MSNIVRPVKGTQDFYPENMSIRTWLYNHFRNVSELFGYEEYEAPILEKLELYAAKSSEEIVEKQSYVFEDRSGEKLTLRPELTPSLARMVAAKQKQLSFPLRWWSFGPFWRYERPQKGRTREFFQWNIDQIGNPSPEADAELIVLAVTLLKNIGLVSGEFTIKVNHRGLLDQQIEGLGIDSSLIQPIFQLIDRKDKISQEAWEKGLEEINLKTNQINKLNDLISNQSLWEASPDLAKIFEILDQLNLRDYVTFSPEIIRGFQYYTGTVFEAWDTQGEFRALFGGGRYDNLVSDVGGEPIGGVGFAAGDKVLTLLLEKLDKLPNFNQSPADVYFTLFSSDLINKSLLLANKLRESHIKVVNHLEEDKLGKQFKLADKYGVKLALVLGPEEEAENKISIKNLTTGEQVTISQDDMVSKIQNMLVSLNPS